jgi:hypothetical protein
MIKLRAAVAVWLVLACVPTALAQDPEIGRVLRFGSYATFSVFGGRPVDSAAKTLAKEFGLQVNVEDPLYYFRDDVEDVTAQVSRIPNPPKRTLVPKSYLLEFAFELRPDGAPADVPGLLQALVDAANVQTPYAYRVDRAEDTFGLVAARTRDTSGRVVELTPLLDCRVDVPAGTRPVFEHVNLLMLAVQKATGVGIRCCTAGGNPWASTVVRFEAHNEPARDALLRLVRSEQRNRFHWLLRCQPEAAAEPWCVVNMVPIQPENRR